MSKVTMTTIFPPQDLGFLAAGAQIWATRVPLVPMPALAVVPQISLQIGGFDCICVVNFEKQDCMSYTSNGSLHVSVYNEATSKAISLSMPPVTIHPFCLIILSSCYQFHYPVIHIVQPVQVATPL